MSDTMTGMLANAGSAPLSADPVLCKRLYVQGKRSEAIALGCPPETPGGDTAAEPSVPAGQAPPAAPAGPGHISGYEVPSAVSTKAAIPGVQLTPEEQLAMALGQARQRYETSMATLPGLGASQPGLLGMLAGLDFRTPR